MSLLSSRQLCCTLFLYVNVFANPMPMTLSLLASNIYIPKAQHRHYENQDGRCLSDFGSVHGHSQRVRQRSTPADPCIALLHAGVADPFNAHVHSILMVSWHFKGIPTSLPTLSLTLHHTAPYGTILYDVITHYTLKVLIHHC